MIEVRVVESPDVGAGALLRPVAADWSAVTPATRRLELAAGQALAEQCQRIGELPVGSAVITGAGELEADYMVHVVVRSGEEPVSVAGVRRGLVNGLRRLSEWAIDSVAVVPLGTGAGNLDVERAAEVMVEVLLEHRRAEPHPSRIVVSVETEYEQGVFERVLGRAIAVSEAEPHAPSAGPAEK